MTCSNPDQRQCDQCGAITSEWCEYRFGDLCLACDNDESVAEPTDLCENDIEGQPAPPPAEGTVTP